MKEKEKLVIAQQQVSNLLDLIQVLQVLVLVCLQLLLHLHLFDRCLDFRLAN